MRYLGYNLPVVSQVSDLSLYKISAKISEQIPEKIHFKNVSQLHSGMKNEAKSIQRKCDGKEQLSAGNHPFTQVANFCLVWVSYFRGWSFLFNATNYPLIKSQSIEICSNRWSSTGSVPTAPAMASPEMTSPGPTSRISGLLTDTRHWPRSWPTSSGAWRRWGWKRTGSCRTWPKPTFHHQFYPNPT